METKNFLFLLSASLLFLTSCSSIERRHAPKMTPMNPSPLPEQPVPMPVVPGRAFPVGIYLSPGGLRTYAQIGVLRALQRAQIPIVAIGGMEWGSVVAANYAMAHGVNEVEWQMMKLHREQLPASSLLHHELVPKGPQDLFSFLRFIFADKELDRG